MPYIRRIISIFILSVCSTLFAQEETQTKLLDTQELLGEWTLDLRPTPNAEAYFQPFVVDSIAENSFMGTFYGSPIEKALINNNWEKLYFAFTTHDVNNAYYHSGYLLDGKMYGITYCPNRDFTAPWTGVKKEE